MAVLSKLGWAHVALLAATIIYGVNYLIAREAMRAYPIHPHEFVLLRVGFGALVFTFIDHYLSGPRPDKKDWPRLIYCAIFGVVINQLCFFDGLKLTLPIHASVIMTLTPVVTFILAVIFLKRPIFNSQIYGIALGWIGAVWMVMDGHKLSFGQEVISGDILIIVNAISFSIFLILVTGLMVKYSPFTIMRWIFSIGLIFVLPLAWPFLGDTPWNDFGAPVWLSLAYILIFTTVLAYMFNTLALRTLSPTVVSAYIYLQPILAGFLSVLFGLENLNVHKLLAAGLVFLGVGLVSWPLEKLWKTKKYRL